MRKHIFSHTETGSNRPGYVVISEEDNGTFSVSVRNPGGTVSTIHLSKDEFEAMGKSCAPAEKSKKEKAV